MTVLARWDPFREFSSLQDRMNRLVRDSFGDGQEALATTSFAPAVDVYEDEHSVTLKIEVPGIHEKDIDVRIENNTLTVHGERITVASSANMAASRALSLCPARWTPIAFLPTTKRAC
jgi:HSP20 family protein